MLPYLLDPASRIATFIASLLKKISLVGYRIVLVVASCQRVDDALESTNAFGKVWELATNKGPRTLNAGIPAEQVHTLCDCRKPRARRVWY